MLESGEEFKKRNEELKPRLAVFEKKVSSLNDKIHIKNAHPTIEQ